MAETKRGKSVRLFFGAEETVLEGATAIQVEMSPGRYVEFDFSGVSHCWPTRSENDVRIGAVGPVAIHPRSSSVFFVSLEPLND